LVAFIVVDSFFELVESRGFWNNYINEGILLDNGTFCPPYYFFCNWWVET